MIEISLRKAKLDDLEMYMKYYHDYDAQFLYSNHDLDDDEESAKKTMFELGITVEPEDDELVMASYKSSLKDIYFINVNQCMVGYIKTEKSRGSLTIRDMTISDYSILNERQLLKLFHELFNITKTDNIIIYYCMPSNKKMLQRIGFEDHGGHLKKVAGV